MGSTSRINGEWDDSTTSRGRYAKGINLYDDEIHSSLKAIKNIASHAKKFWNKKFKQRRHKREDEKRSSYEERMGESLLELFKEVNILKELLGDDCGAQLSRRINDQRRSPSDNADLISQMIEDNNKLQNEIQDLKSSSRQASERLQTAMAEKEDLMTRLSQVAGNKLRDNNPAITDLSDPNRPMKIAEKVSELYDNEWTDAMEALEQSIPELKAVQVLLNVFTGSYEKCRQISTANLEELQQALVDPLRATKHRGQMVLPVPILKQIKDIRKAAAEYTLQTGALQKVVIDELNHREGRDNVNKCMKYIDKCVEYCWYMCIQDPPLYMEYGYRTGMKFNQDKMRAYTQSGPYVEYVVWPTLFLQEGGAILAKAVVQATNTVPQAGGFHAANQTNPYQSHDTMQALPTSRVIQDESVRDHHNYQRHDDPRRSNPQFTMAMHDKSVHNPSDIVTHEFYDNVNVRHQGGHGFSHHDPSLSAYNPPRNDRYQAGPQHGGQGYPTGNQGMQHYYPDYQHGNHNRKEKVWRRRNPEVNDRDVRGMPSGHGYSRGMRQPNEAYKTWSPGSHPGSNINSQPHVSGGHYRETNRSTYYLPSETQI